MVKKEYDITWNAAVSSRFTGMPVNIKHAEPCRRVRFRLSTTGR